MLESALYGAGCSRWNHSHRPVLECRSTPKGLPYVFVTEYDEFMAGYAGVMIGMRWRESLMLLLPSHTWKPRFSFSMGFSSTGVGQRQVLKICVGTQQCHLLSNQSELGMATPCVCTAPVRSCSCP